MVKGVAVLPRTTTDDDLKDYDYLAEAVGDLGPACEDVSSELETLAPRLNVSLFKE